MGRNIFIVADAERSRASSAAACRRGRGCGSAPAPRRSPGGPPCRACADPPRRAVARAGHPSTAAPAPPRGAASAFLAVAARAAADAEDARSPAASAPSGRRRAARRRCVPRQPVGRARERQRARACRCTTRCGTTGCEARRIRRRRLGRDAPQHGGSARAAECGVLLTAGRAAAPSPTTWCTQPPQRRRDPGRRRGVARDNELGATAAALDLHTRARVAERRRRRRATGRSASARSARRGSSGQPRERGRASLLRESAGPRRRARVDGLRAPGCSAQHGAAGEEERPSRRAAWPSDGRAQRRRVDEAARARRRIADEVGRAVDDPTPAAGRRGARDGDASCTAQTTVAVLVPAGRDTGEAVFDSPPTPGAGTTVSSVFLPESRASLRHLLIAECKRGVSSRRRARHRRGRDVALRGNPTAIDATRSHARRDVRARAHDTGADHGAAPALVRRRGRRLLLGGLG